MRPALRRRDMVRAHIMDTAGMPERFYKSPFFIFVCAMMIIVLSFGIRQTFGLFLRPISLDFGWGRADLSLAIATQTLIIGLAAPFAAMIADKWGPVRVIALGGGLYASGVFLMSQSTTPNEMLLSAGFLAGLGLSACALPMTLSIIGRVAPESKRSLWLGLGTGAGTAGQLVMVPLAQAMISTWDWVVSLIIISALAAMIVPLAASMTAAAARHLSRKGTQSLGQALKEARGHVGYWMLVSSYFVCGFQVQFINTHFPAYLGDHGISAAIAATTLSAIGLFNLFGTWGWGWLGGKHRKKYLLGGLYLLRSLVIFVFISVPVTETSALVFSCAVGLLWLGTVPLTSGLVAQVFGTRYMATLYAIVYLSHQIGSFSGVWLGGWLYDTSGSYDVVWWMAIALGFVAAALNWPMNDKPVARLAAEAKAA